MAQIERKILLVAPAGARGERLDRFIAGQVEELSRSAASHLIRRGRVRVGGEKTKAHYQVKGGETIDVWIAAPEPLSAEPEPIPLAVLFEDEHLLVVDKPAGLVTHPSHGHPNGTLVNALVHHCGSLPHAERQDEDLGEAAVRPGIVHRLDQDTSGLMVVAKTPHALWKLCEQFAARTVEKRYLAVVHGLPRKAVFAVDAPIGRHARRRKEMAIRGEGGRDAQTQFEVLARWRVDTFRRKDIGFALVCARPRTGRWLFRRVR